MKKYKEQLIELLKSCDDVKEAMEKLEFGCIIKNTINNKLLRFVGYEKYLDDKTYCFHFSNLDIEKESFSSKYETKNKQLKGKKDNFLHIIGLPLQERFIRMYCKNNIIHIFADVTLISFSKRGVFSENIKINNELDFNQQSEETYKQIFLALTNLTNNE